MGQTTNIFCEPSPMLTDISDEGLFEWSADGIAWQALPNPPATAVYFRFTSSVALADGSIDFTLPAGGGYSLPATTAGNVLTTDALHALAAGIYNLFVDGNFFGVITLS